MIKRYLVFMWSSYSVAGGWNDFRGSYDSLEEAKDVVLDFYEFDKHHIVDLQTGEKHYL